LKPSGMAGVGSEGLMVGAWTWVAMDTTTPPALNPALQSFPQRLAENRSGIPIA